MSDIKTEYGTSNQSITISLNNLAIGALRQSAVVDNSPASARFSDALVFMNYKRGAIGFINEHITIYVYGTADGGTSYTSKASGSDAAYGAGSGERRQNLRVLAVVNVPNGDNDEAQFGPFSVAEAFGELPEKWGVVVANDTSKEFNATSGNSMFYQGVYKDRVA